MRLIWGSVNSRAGSCSQYPRNCSSEFLLVGFLVLVDRRVLDGEVGPWRDADDRTGGWLTVGEQAQRQHDGEGPADGLAGAADVLRLVAAGEQPPIGGLGVVDLRRVGVLGR